MFRKTILALTTIAAVSAAALVPASAGKGKHHPHFGFRTGVIVAAPIVPTCGLQYQWLQTRRGLRQVLVDTCTGIIY
jgi:hypothetical protein